MSADDIRATIDVHVLGAIWMCRKAWPHLRAAGYGRIINSTSASFLGQSQRQTTYGTAKGAVFALTRAVALEGHAHGIKCNAVAPGAGTRAAVVTLQEDSPMLQQMMTTMPPELVAPLVAFLAHEDCPVSGETFTAGGGHVSRLFVSLSRGYTNVALTPEDIWDNFEHIMNDADASISAIPFDEALTIRPKPYTP